MKQLIALFLLLLFVYIILKWTINRYNSVIHLLTDHPDELVETLSDKSERVSTKRKNLSKILKIQTFEQFLNQTDLSQKSKDASFSRVRLIEIGSKQKTHLPRGKISAILSDMALLPSSSNSSDILYCAFVHFHGKWFRYVGITTQSIEKRWGFQYPSSHFVQWHAARCGSVARMEQGFFGAFKKTRDYRYIMMALVKPEEVIVMYKKFNARDFARRLFDHSNIEKNLSDTECRELAEVMLIKKYKTDFELNEKSNHPSDLDDEVIATDFSKFLQ